MPEITPLRITAISGSLRAASSNTSVLLALAAMAPENVEISIYDGIDGLPFFSPERDTEEAHPAVTLFRRSLNEADAVIICTPEYAFGPPGVLKNALDWTVSSGNFSKKPLALISASPLAPGADKAHAALMLTFKALDAIITDETKLIIPFIYKKINSDAAIIDEETKQQLETLLKSLVKITIEKKLEPIE
jgi:chromate reductase, NAD(P)H dehydrogenase (quinone)